LLRADMIFGKDNGKTALEGLQKIGFRFEDEPTMP